MKVLKQCNEKEDENIMEEGKNSSEKEKTSPLWKDVLALVFKIVVIMFLFILAFTLYQLPLFPVRVTFFPFFNCAIFALEIDAPLRKFTLLPLIFPETAFFVVAFTAEV